jgi:hypothetical protein
MTTSAERMHSNATKIFYREISEKPRCYGNNAKIVKRVNDMYGSWTVFVNEDGMVELALN